MRRVAVVLLMGSIALSVPGTALAGGWWTTLDFHDQHVAVGESLSIHVRGTLFESMGAAEEGHRTEYFAYAVEAFDERALDEAMSRADPGDWWRPLTPPLRIGTVTLTNRDANLSRARVDLDVPDMPLGRYSLMLCDAGCENPLGNHIPVPINITADVLAAQTARRLDRANERLTFALDRVRRDVRRTDGRLSRMQASQAEAADAVAPPRTRVVEPESEQPWIAYAAWFLAGGLAALVLVRRRPRRVPDELVIERIPDDARELTKTS
ncbi:MAG TPA: hypothetical protein VG318_09465 [Actinomycetota bacterium]|nr:hypothetical protein [Actinomycetota bacterium]